MSLIPIESFSAHLLSGDGPSFEIFSSYRFLFSCRDRVFHDKCRNCRHSMTALVRFKNLKLACLRTLCPYSTRSLSDKRFTSGNALLHQNENLFMS